MSFSAGDVKELRERTGAGMMACKTALTETSGDMEKAVDYLRAKGLAAAAKKQSRVAADGIVTALVEGNKGLVLEVNCETDFVSKGDDFRNFVNKVASIILATEPKNTEELKNATFEGSLKVSDAFNELTLKIGEKIDLRRFSFATREGNGSFGSYIHGGKIAVLVDVAATTDVTSNEVFQEFLKDITMHVAAAAPVFINAADIDQDYQNREAEVYAAQLKEQGKPENMIPNIVKGKLAKLASEVCLLEQKFVKNPDISIKDLVAEVSKKLDTTLTINKFFKINLGEGIEKKQDNLADEVAKMTQG